MKNICIICGVFIKIHAKNKCKYCYKRDWELTHPEVKKQYCLLNADKARVRSNTYYYENRDEILRKESERYRQNPELFRIRNRQTYERRKDRLKDEYTQIKLLAFQKVSHQTIPECIICKLTDMRILELNYIPRGHRKLIKRNILPCSLKLYKKVLKGEVDLTLFDVRCKVCNMAHYVEGKFGIKYIIQSIKPNIIENCTNINN